MKTKTVKIAVLIDPQGRWAAQGHFNIQESPDWDWLDEWLDDEAPVKGARRFMIAAEVPIPDDETNEISATNVEPA